MKQDRIIDEAFDLFEKIVRLDVFSKTEMYDKLPEEEKCMLKEQNEAMRKYYECLRRRMMIMFE